MGGEYFAIGSEGATFDFPVGGVEWTGAEIRGPGALTNGARFDIVRNDSGGVPELSGHLINQATLTLRGNSSGGLINSGGAKIDNLAGARFEFHDAQGIGYANEPLTLTNHGHLAQVGGGSSTLQVCYLGPGTLDASIVIFPNCL